jgi:hypothetical protein
MKSFTFQFFAHTIGQTDNHSTPGLQTEALEVFWRILAERLDGISKYRRGDMN